MKPLLATMAGLALCAGSLTAAEPGPFLRAEGNKLYLGDKEYRAIGVNMPYASRVFTGQMNGIGAPDCFVRTPEEQAAWVRDAAEQGFAFVRLFAYPNTPAEIDWYHANKEAYWKKMDEFVAMCGAAGLKLVPSLGIYPRFHHTPHTGEKTTAILDPESKTHRQIYGYVRDMVTRYRDDPTILMWELTNEGFLKADVPNPNDKTDIMTFAQFQQMYREATEFIKSLDPNHLVTSGDAHVRPESMSRRLGTKLRMDTLREHMANQIESQLEPLDVIQFHYYVPASVGFDGKFSFTDKEGNSVLGGGQRPAESMMTSVRMMHALGLPVFLGELGQQYPFLNQDPSAGYLKDAVKALDAEGVSLIALWVWRFPEQPEYTFDAEKDPELVKLARSLNRKYGTLPATCKIAD